MTPRQWHLRASFAVGSGTIMSFRMDTCSITDGVQHMLNDLPDGDSPEAESPRLVRLVAMLLPAPAGHGGA